MYAIQLHSFLCAFLPWAFEVQTPCRLVAFFFCVPPDVTSLQFRTPKVISVQLKLCKALERGKVAVPNRMCLRLGFL
jgi:hypothetical protein